jgi:hypothetical protein
MTIRMVRSAGVVVIGTLGVTTLHPWALGEPELTPLPKAVPPSLEESLMAVCKDGEPLCTIPMNKALG